MRKLTKESSRFALRRDFIIFAGVTLLMITLLFTFTAASVFYSQTAKQEQLFNVKADALDRSLTQTLNYIENILVFVGNSINDTDLSLEQISHVLKDQGNNVKIQELLSWTVYDWVDKNKKIVINSTHGILKKPVKSDRLHLNYTPQSPGKLFISDANVGLVSKQLVIPAGVGVRTKPGRFLGTVNVGILVSEIISQMEIALGNNDNYSFAIINRNSLRLISGSSGNQTNQQEIGEFNNKLHILQNTKSDSGLLEAPLKLGNIDYKYYRNASQYPFVILLGVNRSYADAEFINSILPHIIQTIAIAIFTIVILYYFRKRLVNPIVQLAEAATLVSQDATNVEIPHPKIWELHILASQIVKVQYLVRQLNKTNQQLKKYMNILAHDICSPLASASGFAEIMKKEMLGKHAVPEYKEYAENIYQTTHHAIDLAQELLENNKIEDGHRELNKSPVNLTAILDESINANKANAANKQIKLVKEYKTDEIIILSERKILLRIFMNLLSNAIKYSEKDKDKHVWVNLEVGSEYITVSIKDEGYGMEDVEEAVKPYGKNSAPNKHEVSSIGLGLYSVKQMVEKLHGGKLVIESQVGKGTTVHCNFPIELLQEQA